MKITNKPSNISQKDWDAVDFPEITEDELKQMRPAHEVHPEIVKEYMRTRGKQKAPTKTPVSIRLSPEVVNFFKATGKGWQTRIDNALLDFINK